MFQHIGDVLGFAVQHLHVALSSHTNYMCVEAPNADAGIFVSAGLEKRQIWDSCLQAPTLDEHEVCADDILHADLC